MRLARAMSGLVLVAALLGTGSARADIFAAGDVLPSGSGNSDVAVMNATTGARVALPAGVNTPGTETSPGVMTNGRRLAFARIDGFGTVRIIVTDLSTGQSADLFNGFESAQHEQLFPAFSPDGATVYTGGALNREQDTYFADVTTTGLGPFPTGPFSHGRVRSGITAPGNRVVTHPNAGGDLLGFEVGRQIVLTSPSGASPGVLAATDRTYSHPALAAVAPQVLLLRQQSQTDHGLGPGSIVFLPASPSALSDPPGRLPVIVNHDEVSRPTLTADGRYVGFYRSRDGEERLFVWDSETQTLLNPSGIDLGRSQPAEFGNLSLYTTRSLLALATTTATGAVAALVKAPTGIGLLVQRIVGRHRVLGRRAFKLRSVGRVPLGTFKRGRMHTHWNLKVNGKRLRPGRYLVTVRAVSRKRVVRELAKPHVIRIRRR